MSDIKEKRYIERLIQGILDKCSCMENCELKDIVQYIMAEKDTPFDLGFFFLYDQVENTFKLGEVFPESYTGVRKNIEETLQNIDCNLDSRHELPPKCGLFLWVAREFKKNLVGKDFYLPIDDLQEFKKKNDLAKYDIDIDVDVLKGKIKSEYILPVSINNDQKSALHPGKILHAIIVLASFTRKNKIPKHDLKILSDLISFIISVEARKIANSAFQTYIDTLANFEKIEHPREEYKKFIDSLRYFFIRNIGESTLKQCHLKHASLWALNTIDPGNTFLVKEENFNFPDSGSVTTNIITNELIGDPHKHHYFYEFITGQIKKIEQKGSDLVFKDIIEVSNFGKVGRRFYHKEQFQETYRLSNEDIVVLFPILPHIGNKQKPKNVYLMVFYFDKNTCSYYYNPHFLELMSHKIYENIQIVIQKSRKYIRRRIFKNISTVLEKDEAFYSQASSIIKETLDFEHCLIYLFSEDRERLELKTKEDIGLFPEVFNIKGSESTNIIYKILKNEQAARRTIRYIKELITATHVDRHLIWYSRDALQPSYSKEKNSIYSAMMIPIQVPENPAKGVLICLNNWRYTNVKDKRENSFFSFKDYEIASIGAESMAIYTEILSHARMYKKLLRRLSHEIPTQAGFIMQNVEQIRDEFTNILDKIGKLERAQGMDKLIDDYRRKLIFNQFTQQYQAALRVQVFAEFSHWERLEEINVKKEKEQLDMYKFLASIIDGLRLNAGKHGVFVEFDFIYDMPHKKDHIIQAHPLFRLAVWNLINNAIQYAYFGTTVFITFKDGLNNHDIHVENIGINIPDETKEKIFDEGFRGEMAKRKYFKGTGWGLTLAKKVIEAHHGQIILTNKNNICDRNIFGILEIKNLFEQKPSDADREKFINQKLPQKKSYHDFKKQLIFTASEEKTLEHYRKLSIVFSERADSNLVKDYFQRLFDGNENIDILFQREIDIPVSYVKFSIKLPKNVVSTYREDL
ncbi:MAG: HAMP domain-containing sensor histidine kinase [Candidatus Aminicenantes bacterium]|nr:HAMP domain-containing sensor histidine kinase [Candidatus Aminicenantes bacterium]